MQGFISSNVVDISQVLASLGPQVGGSTCALPEDQGPRLEPTCSPEFSRVLLGVYRFSIFTTNEVASQEGDKAMTPMLHLAIVTVKDWGNAFRAEEIEREPR